MKEYPVIFSTDMVKAIQDGSKTMTRRVIKQNQKNEWLLEPSVGWSDDYIKDPDNELIANCPYGQAGDRLWVRETFSIAPEHKPVAYPEKIPPVFYKADNDKPTWANNWTPSIHMFRKDSRITLENTEVRVERVQEISEGDAVEEGVRMTTLDFKDGIDFPNFRSAFQYLWDSINAKRGYSWGSNPWVWVISFKEEK